MDRVYLKGKSRAATTDFRFLNMSSVISYLWPQTYGNAFFAETWRPYSTLSQAILFQSWDPRLPLFFFLLQLIHEDALRCRSRSVRAWQRWNETEVGRRVTLDSEPEIKHWDHLGFTDQQRQQQRRHACQGTASQGMWVLYGTNSKHLWKTQT